MSFNPFRKNSSASPKFDSFRNTKPVLLLIDALAVPRNWIRRLYNWVVKWAAHKNAQSALAGISFAESSFFPLPPDPLLMAMVFAKPKRWVRYAFITLITSVVGGAFGYLIGFGLMESVGQWIIDSFHLQKEFVDLGKAYSDNATIAVFAAALTPIPYKLVTITAGAFQINFPVFIIASIVGRGTRFFAVAALAAFLGQKYKDQIEKYIDLVSILLLVVLIGLFVILRN